MGDETGSPAPPRPRQGRAGRRPWDVATCTAASIGIATDSPASRLLEDCCVGLIPAASGDAGQDFCNPWRCEHREARSPRSRKGRGSQLRPRRGRAPPSRRSGSRAGCERSRRRPVGRFVPRAQLEVVGRAARARCPTLPLRPSSDSAAFARASTTALGGEGRAAGIARARRRRGAACAS